MTYVMLGTTSCLLLISIILAVYVMILAKDVPAAVFIPLNDLKLRLNFTDADEECRTRFAPHGKLFVPETIDDENQFISALRTQPDAYHRACPTVLTGVRIKVMEKFKSPDGFVLPLEFESRQTKEVVPLIPSGTTCIVNEYNMTSNEITLRRVACTGGEYSCALCEVVPRTAHNRTRLPSISRCRDRSHICYVLWESLVPRAFKYMPALCKEIGGRLATISDFQLTDYQAKSLASNVCHGKPVAALSSSTKIELETITGKSVSYGVKNLEPGAGIDNCVGGTTDSKYPLKYSPCFVPQCYACQITSENRGQKPNRDPN